MHVSWTEASHWGWPWLTPAPTLLTSTPVRQWLQCVRTFCRRFCFIIAAAFVWIIHHPMLQMRKLKPRQVALHLLPSTWLPSGPQAALSPHCLPNGAGAVALIWISLTAKGCYWYSPSNNNKRLLLACLIIKQWMLIKLLMSKKKKVTENHHHHLSKIFPGFYITP